MTTKRYAILDKARQVIDGETYATKAELFRNMSYCSSKWLDTASVWELGFEAGTMRDVTDEMIAEWWAATGSTDALEARLSGDAPSIFACLPRRVSHVLENEHA